MDLNHLYSEHQMSLMRATGSTDETLRRKHISAAELIGGQIFDLLASKNAAASSSWRRWSDRSVRTHGMKVAA